MLFSVSLRGNVLNRLLHSGDLLLVESLVLESVHDFVKGYSFIALLGLSLFPGSAFLGFVLSLFGSVLGLGSLLLSFELSLGSLSDLLFFLSLSLGGLFGSFLFLLLVPAHAVLGFELSELFSVSAILVHSLDSSLGLSPLLFLCVKHSLVGRDSSFSFVGISLASSEAD